MINGEVSHWMHPTPAPTEADLPGSADLVVVGAGLTGLWTAYYATEHDPDVDVVVVEAEHVGYGASGRNGGWLSPLVPGNRAVYARRHGLDATVALQRELFATIDETLRVADTEGIDVRASRGGGLEVATTPAGATRLREARETDLRFGYPADQCVLLTAQESREHVDIRGTRAATYTPATSAIDPARLVHGLADVCRRRGVRIVEGVRVTHLVPGRVETTHGPVRGETVLCCTEAYSGPLIGERRLIPVNSSMVATEPLPPEAWERIGWSARECLGDMAHAFVYAQRTADGRIAIGGRGSPYRYGSGLPGRGEVDAGTVAMLQARLRDFFPGVDLPVAHAWRGAIGVTRDWCATVEFDPATRVGNVHGFAGHGVTSTNLAARTLLDRASGRSTELTRLAWNDHQSRMWEPEPLRWLGVHGMYRLFGWADRRETRRGTPRTSWGARLGSRLAGLHE